MTATILQFLPKARCGDPDFPGIPTLKGFYAGLTDEQKKAALEYRGEDSHTRRDDLTMDHADTAPSEWVAPDYDGA